MDVAQLTNRRMKSICHLTLEYWREEEAYDAPSKANDNSVPDYPSLYPGGQHPLAIHTKCAVPVEG